MDQERYDLSGWNEGNNLFHKKQIKESQKKEIKTFLNSLSYHDFQDLLEVWAKSIALKQVCSISMKSEDFYKTQIWRRLRYLKLKEQKTCELCGWGRELGRKLHVDHIDSRWLFPEKAFDPFNLQVLCDDCNLGKGITDCSQPRRTARVRRIILRKAGK